MRRTIYLKFILAYVIFGFFGLVAVASFAPSMALEQISAEQANALYREANLIAGTFASDLYSSQTSLDSVKNQIDALSTYLAADIWIINPSGRMVVDSSSEVDVEDPRIVTFDPTATQGSYYSMGDFFGYFPEEMLSVFAPITLDYKVSGYVIIHYPTESLRKRADSLTGISYILYLIMLLLSMIILYFFTEVVYRPLRKIISASEQYANGNLHYPLQIDSEDEMGYLAAVLSYMSGRIARSEDSQKKFIANVSHDFKSPLTSIRGYLTAMLDGTIPQELHEKYIQVVLNETDRLTKLTTGLLTLNSLGTEDMLLNIEDFDINAVIRSIAASTEGLCSGRQISLSLILTGEEMPVRGDMERISQVIYNLLDNAIKFSHTGGRIKIETTLKGHKLLISVKDEGIGIPKDSLSLIWGRFYKTDLSRGKDKKGTGLGLSIVREIIKAHGETIDVISTEGAGTEFVFTLPAVEDDE